MTFTEFRAQAMEELSWIPRDDDRLGQRTLRSAYWNIRISNESRTTEETAADVLRRSIDIVRRFYPNFVPSVTGPFAELVEGY